MGVAAAAVPTAPDTGRRPWRLRMTIRRKLLVGCAALACITGCLGALGTYNVAVTGSLVTETFDRSLMAVSYARAASADFGAMTGLVPAYRLAAPADKALIAAEARARAQSLRENLAVVEERILTDAGRRASRAVVAELAAWEAARTPLLGPRPDRAATTRFDRLTADVWEQLDVLVNRAAEDGFRQHQRALRAVQESNWLSVGGTASAMALSVLLAFLLARRITQPLATASAAAGRIAAGDLAMPIPGPGVPDEFGELLSAMSVMHVSIQQATFLARHDPLTRLANRIALEERLEQSVALLGRGVGFAVHCLDMDRFKGVNDTLGHLVGDKLLQQVADRLAACVRDVDLAARLGGDEFVVVQSGAETAEDAAELARRIVSVLNAPYEVDGHRIATGISVGVALAPVDGANAEELVRKADAALYEAKGSGRGTYRLFDAAMDGEARAGSARTDDGAAPEPVRG